MKNLQDREFYINYIKKNDILEHNKFTKTELYKILIEYLDIVHNHDLYMTILHNHDYNNINHSFYYLHDIIVKHAPFPYNLVFAIFRYYPCGLCIDEESLTKQINKLTDKQRDVINLRYNSGEHYTQKDVAKILNISTSRVQQIEKKALIILRLNSLRTFYKGFHIDEIGLSNKLCDIMKNVGIFYTSELVLKLLKCAYLNSIDIPGITVAMLNEISDNKFIKFYYNYKALKDGIDELVKRHIRYMDMEVCYKPKTIEDIMDIIELSEISSLIYLMDTKYTRKHIDSLNKKKIKRDLERLIIKYGSDLVLEQLEFYMKSIYNYYLPLSIDRVSP